MAQQTMRMGLAGSALVRLLAGLSGDLAGRGRESPIAFADGLGQWTGWTDAIALSAALDRPATAAATGEPSPCEAQDQTAGPARYDEERAEYARVRALLAQTIQREAQAAGRSPFDADLGFRPYRQCHAERQQAMDLAIGVLRERVRAALLAGTPALARLASVDAAMAQVLGVQEQRLLGAIPAMLEKHFARQRAAASKREQEGGSGDDATAWLDGFRHDLQAVLLAELELRLQPVEGLIEALRHQEPQHCS